MKVAILFVVAFLLLGLPVAVAAIVGLMGPPYVIVSPGPGPEWEAGRTLPDGSRVTTTAFATEAEAVAALKGALTGISTSAQSETLRVRRYTHASDGTVGWVSPVGRYLVRVEAPDRATVDASVASLPFMSENPKKNLVWLAFTRHLGATLAGIGAYALLYLLFLARGAAWAARIDPTVATAVSVDVLRDRLLALDALDVPFHVVAQGPDRLVAEWRIADARWAGPIHAGGLSKAHTITLALDARSRRVRVVDEEREIRWDGTIGSLGGRASWFRGITFTRYERGAAVGLLFDEGGGWSVRPAFDYRFVLSEMKGPLIDVITASGWTWSPVVTLFRPIGG